MTEKLRTARLRWDVAANFAGNGWVVLLSLAFVPVYIHFLGIEAYGLIGFFTSFQALLALLDLGLSSAVNREIARLSIDRGNTKEMGDLLRTLEIAYWGGAIVVGGLLVALASPVAGYWLRASRLPAHEIEQALMMMGLSFAARWPFALYSGALMGLQRQVLLNGIRIVTETLKSAGAAIVLWQVSPTLTAFFSWQIANAFIATIVVGLAAWRYVPIWPWIARFRAELLQRVWRFAAGVSGITLTVVVLTQADKLIISSFLTLEALGYYTLAWTVAAGMRQLIGPVFAAYYPRLSRAVAEDNRAALAHLYHQGSQLMTLATVPVGCVLAAFSYEILLLWTQNQDIAVNAHLVLTVLVLGTVLNGLMTMPYALQLAHGWTKLTILANFVSIGVLMPLLVVLSLAYGTVGAATVWLLLNISYVLIVVPVMHRRLLQDEQRRWWRTDIALGCIGPFVAVCVARMLPLESMAGPATVATIGSSLIAGIVISALALPGIRRAIWEPRTAE